jgi:type I restriction enzyme R subunit
MPFDLQDALDNFQVYDREQVQEFSEKILQNVAVDQLYSIF